MALTRKGSRLITVDGVVYRWRTRGRPTYPQAPGELPLAVAVEQAGYKGSDRVAAGGLSTGCRGTGSSTYTVTTVFPAAWP